MTIFVLFSFCHYVVLWVHILNISKTIFPKLRFHFRLGDKLSDVRLQEFYIHPPYVIYQFYFYNISILEKKKFCLLFKTDLTFFFQCK